MLDRPDDINVKMHVPTGHLKFHLTGTLAAYQLTTTHADAHMDIPQVRDLRYYTCVMFLLACTFSLVHLFSMELVPVKVIYYSDVGSNQYRHACLFIASCCYRLEQDTSHLSHLRLISAFPRCQTGKKKKLFLDAVFKLRFGRDADDFGCDDT